MKRAAAVFWGSLATAVLSGVLVLFVLPTRTYLDQRHQLAVASRRVRVLSDQNSSLSARVDKLHTDVEIERLARERYHLVRPGEQAYVILPAPAPTIATLAVAPPPVVAHPGLWQRTWDHVTAWF